MHLDTGGGESFRGASGRQRRQTDGGEGCVQSFGNRAAVLSHTAIVIESAGQEADGILRDTDDAVAVALGFGERRAAVIGVQPILEIGKGAFPVRVHMTLKCHR